jgi:hypothetical protein
LHGLWAIAILVLLNSCGGARNVDSISISLTILEIVLVVALVGGFWVIRPEVKEAARDAAKEAAVLEARRATEEWLSANGGSSANPQALADALDKDDGDGEGT